MELKYEKLMELFKDEAVAQKLMACSAEEAGEILKSQYGLEFTTEELDEVAAGIRTGLTEESGDELNADQLEQVVGGGKSAAYYTGYYIGKGIKAVGAGIGIAAGLVALGVVSW